MLSTFKLRRRWWDDIWRGYRTQSLGSPNQSYWCRTSQCIRCCGCKWCYLGAQHVRCDIPKYRTQHLDRSYICECRTSCLTSVDKVHPKKEFCVLTLIGQSRWSKSVEGKVDAHTPSAHLCRWSQNLCVTICFVVFRFVRPQRFLLLDVNIDYLNWMDGVVHAQAFWKTTGQLSAIWWTISSLFPSRRLSKLRN